MKGIKSNKKGPEAIIQQNIVDFLRIREWFVKETHGNEFSHGLPDLYACCKRYGARWIEVKNPIKYSWTGAQVNDYPLFIAHGVGIWVMTEATEEEYKKLFKPCNLQDYFGRTSRL